jgi:hypothetical protein
MNLRMATAFGVVLTLTSCSLLPGQDPHVVEASDGTLLLVSSLSGEGMEALISGTLEKGEGDCLYIGGEDYDSLVIWSARTTFNDDETAVLMPGYDPLSIGSWVEIGGGHTSVDGPSYPTIPSECDSEYVVSVN